MLHPLPLLPPQKHSKRIIQIRQSHPQPLLHPQLSLSQPPPRIPLPQPLQQNSKRIIQIQLPPNPLFLHPQELLLQPQFVEVKSLIFKPPNFIYALLYVILPVNVSILNLIFFITICG